MQLKTAFAGVTALTALLAGASPATSRDGDPAVRIKNGTLVGRYSPEYDQDFFLGVPFAQPPVGELRFKNPASLNESWCKPKVVREYAKSCVGYSSNNPLNHYGASSEDCLYLNILRPSGLSPNSDKLPVAVWIHGGGFEYGAAADQRFNMSFTLQNAQEIGHPIIGVTIDYRLTAWGFLSSEEVRANGQSNMGIRDQRLALHWINENIGAFGGDKDKVTIFGESAGAASVGFHLTAYDGRDDGLFRGAIMQSGNPIFYANLNNSVSLQQAYDDLVADVGCDTADALECLRALPFDTLNDALNGSSSAASWGPQIDGDIIARYSSAQIADGAFVHVPMMLGSNSDEGSAFGTRGINTDEQFRAYLEGEGMNASYAAAVLDAYPRSGGELPGLGFLGPNFTAPATPYGLQWQRMVTYAGDQTFAANRRASCAAWADAGVDAYCFRFNAIQNGEDALIGVTHASDVAFVFDDTINVGYAEVGHALPFAGLNESYYDLAHLMNADWISFIAVQDPNSWPGRADAQEALDLPVPAWPKYDTGAPEVFVFNGNTTSFAQADTYRIEGMALINAVNIEVFGR